MGQKESEQIHLKIIKRFDDQGACVPLAIIESLPEGYPPRERCREFVDKITRLLSEKDDLGIDEFWTQVIQYFWPNKTVNDLSFRSADDPAVLRMLNYVCEHGLPIIANVSVPEEHAIGLQFIKTKQHGIVAEFIYGLAGQRPFIPLDGSDFHDEDNFLKTRFFGAEGTFIVLPPIEELS